MTIGPFLGMASYLFNILGIVVCLVGLTLARRPHRRRVGYAMAVLGFLIAASPLLAQLFGLIEAGAPAGGPR